MGNDNVMKFEYGDFLQLIKTDKKEKLTSQQHLLQQYVCMIVDHDNKLIDGICMNEVCKQKNRKICFDCSNYKIHDEDHGKISLIGNADQLQRIISSFKNITINNQIPVNLEVCDKISENLAHIKYNELKKVYDQIQQIQFLISQINFKSYLSEQYERNTSLFEYLKDQHKGITKINIEISEYQQIKNKFQYLSKEDQQFYAQNIKLENIQAIRKKKIQQKKFWIKNLHISIIKKMQRYDEAILLYDQGIKLDPNDSTIYNNKGVALHSQLKYDKLSLCMNELDNMILKEMLFIQYQIQESYRHVQQSNIAQSKSFPLLNQKGLTLVQQQKYQQAIFVYNLAIQFDLKEADKQRNQGDVFYLKQQYQQAILLFQKAIELNPKEAIYYNQNDWRIAPNQPVFHNQRGLTLYLMQNYQEAILMFDSAIKLDQQEIFILNRGQILKIIERNVNR